MLITRRTRDNGEVRIKTISPPPPSLHTITPPARALSSLYHSHSAVPKPNVLTFSESARLVWSCALLGNVASISMRTLRAACERYHLRDRPRCRRPRRVARAQRALLRAQLLIALNRPGEILSTAPTLI
jgi:hypothetical protein